MLDRDFDVVRKEMKGFVAQGLVGQLVTKNGVLWLDKGGE